jgi:hypothetical protein
MTDDEGVRQLGSSLFDMLVGVTVLLAIPAAVLHPEPLVVAVAVAAVLLLAGRLITERRSQAKRA